MSRPHPLSNAHFPSSPGIYSSPAPARAAPPYLSFAPPAKRSKLNPLHPASLPVPASTSDSTLTEQPAGSSKGKEREKVEFSPELASAALQRVIGAALKEAGFDSADASAMWAIEEQLVAWMDLLLSGTHERAEVGRRTKPSARDMLATAVQDGELVPEELGKKARKEWLLQEPVAADDIFTILPPPLEPEVFLPSDDEAPLHRPRTTSRSAKAAKHAVPPLPYAPSHLPPLPPRHSYLRTAPRSPEQPKAAHADIAALEERYAQTRTVERALVRLIDGTTHAGAEGSLEEMLRDAGLGLVGWRVRERVRGEGGKRKAA